jgi:hypothetical protein
MARIKRRLTLMWLWRHHERVIIRNSKNEDEDILLRLSFSWLLRLLRSEEDVKTWQSYNFISSAAASRGARRGAHRVSYYDSTRIDNRKPLIVRRHERIYRHAVVSS